MLAGVEERTNLFGMGVVVAAYGHDIDVLTVDDLTIIRMASGDAAAIGNRGQPHGVRVTDRSEFDPVHGLIRSHVTFAHAETDDRSFHAMN